MMFHMKHRDGFFDVSRETWKPEYFVAAQRCLIFKRTSGTYHRSGYLGNYRNPWILRSEIFQQGGAVDCKTEI